ncbi:hypothetical protein [Paraburkholderia hayleyella]|uniref:hypothetical protein n=1 Tax=Paraburkholderia hayleyella TaxID=2152889 RepID=UPI001292AF36|nr:hypothetical protein [Paraburkholderia hayleyella]
MSEVQTTNPAENRIGATEIGKLIWDGAASVAEWFGGALAGEFNQKQTTGQIVFDAVISMFPILGEGTAARDSIAICIGMCEDPKKAEDRWQWVKLVLCLIAVVPIVGGVLKGVGKLVVRALEKGEDLEKLAAEIVSFANRMGQGNAYQWLRQLDFMQYQDKVLAAVGEFLDRFTRACQYIVKNLAGVLPQDVVQYLSGLPPKLQNIGKLANRMVPQALSDLNDCLVRVRAHLVDGTFADISVGSGKITTREAEGRLAKAARGAGDTPHPPATPADYRPVKDWPNLAEGRNVVLDEETGKKTYQTIASFSHEPQPMPIVAETLKEGSPVRLIRVLDTTRPPDKLIASKAGSYWLQKMPQNGKEWREDCAVLHDWSQNGGYIELTKIPTIGELRAAEVPDIPADWKGLRVWSGNVSSQEDPKLGRYLAGGAKQIFIDFNHPHNKVLEDYVKRLSIYGTNWKDMNFANSERVAVMPLEKSETAAKTVPQGYTNRISATARHAVPDSKAEHQ